jgi:hypothetical protein
MKEALGSCCITLVSQQEVDGLPAGIDSLVHKSLSSLDVDVRLVEAPTSIRLSQVRTAALVHLRTKHLNPTQMQLAEIASPRSTAISAMCFTRSDTSDTTARTTDDVSAIVLTFEWIRRCDWQHLPYQCAPLRFRNGTLRSTFEGSR